MDIQSCIYYKVRTPIIMAKQNKEVKVKIVDGNFGTMCIYDDEIFFNPPLYQQRYQKVKDKITSVSKGTFTKVVDVGDPKLQFFQYLQAIPGVREIVFLDKDDKTLKDCDYRINPLNTDLYILRELPLNVKAVCGDVTKYDPTLFGSQVVTMIELIEHLEISELHALVKCQELIEDNSSYSVEYSGCGLGPDNTYCTQMAFFLLSTEYQEELLSCIVKELLNIDVKDPTCCEEPVKMGEVTEGVAPSVIREDSYKIIAEFDFPLDMRTQEEKDRDFTLGRFYSLINYLLTGERDDKPQLNWGLIPEDTECSLDDTECSLDDTDDELVFFIVQYIKNDEEIVEKQRDNNDESFEKSLEDNDEDQDEWFPNDEHCEHMNKQVVGFSNNENTTVNPEADDYWDV
ncbi:Small RNA 2'-O-methyltransferase-like 2, partial [Homarus americanus]